MNDTTAVWHVYNLGGGMRWGTVTTEVLKATGLRCFRYRVVKDDKGKRESGIVGSLQRERSMSEETVV